jgi:tetratricopeptide (TPR) repeat protein
VGGSVISDDGYTRLFRQYTAAAEQLVKQGDFIKASFVYLKLLKNYEMAAATLEKGGHFAEAAAVYLKYCKNEEKAAECFEQAAMYEKAIELHLKGNNYTKVADLYRSLNNEEQAVHYYHKLIEIYMETGLHLQASVIYDVKLHQTDKAKDILLFGWKTGRDSYNCLKAYFAHHDDIELAEEIPRLYAQDVPQEDRELFMRVLQKLYQHRVKVQSLIKDISFEIIVGEAEKNPGIVSEIRIFNKEDKQLVKDLLRFKLSKK